MKVNKPIVYYAEELGPVHVGTRAVLAGVTKHHVLSSYELEKCNNVVTTSNVLRIFWDAENNRKMIETENTVYVQGTAVSEAPAVAA